MDTVLFHILPLPLPPGDLAMRQKATEAMLL